MLTHWWARMSTARERREQMRRAAQEKLPPGLRLPRGFRLQPRPIVECAAWGQQLRVPQAMTVKLSEKAQSLLTDHAEAHRRDR